MGVAWPVAVDYTGGEGGLGQRDAGLRMKKGNSLLSGTGTTVFEVMSQLAREHGAVNLGQGFPDSNGPEDVVARAQAALVSEVNQYPPMMGIPALREAVAVHGARFYGLEADWQREVLVTSGATQALAACLMGLIEPGDEVVLIEPLYDSYLPMVERLGGVAKLVRVEAPDWALPREALAAAFGPKTKLLLMNSPMNPVGKVFSREELEFIAWLLAQHDAYAVCDEVYEHITFDGRAHVPLITLPGMRERCARIGSAGKTFSLTGWKVGYVTAAPGMLAPITKAHQFLVFTTPPNLQHAVAYGLGLGDAYFDGLKGEMEAKRDRLAAGLTGLGLDVMACEGTYFLNAALPIAGSDEEIGRTLTVDAGVTAIPLSAFTVDGADRGVMRFCFAKKDAVLDEALGRLKRYFQGQARESAPSAAE